MTFRSIDDDWDGNDLITIDDTGQYYWGQVDDREVTFQFKDIKFPENLIQAVPRTTKRLSIHYQDRHHTFWLANRKLHRKEYPAWIILDPTYFNLDEGFVECLWFNHGERPIVPAVYSLRRGLFNDFICWLTVNGKQKKYILKNSHPTITKFLGTLKDYFYLNV